MQRLTLSLWASFVFISAIGTASDAASAADKPASSVGYPTVAAARTALQARSDVVSVVQNKWTVINDRAAHTVWSFAPPGDPSYPSVVKRQAVKENGVVGIKMDILCEVSRKACENLVIQFEHMNAELRGKTAQKRAAAPAS